ncbi:aminoglycoside adenylyltransferase domain-containing protein [Butyrivibrio sp. XPD2006]|uniref:aminoglycoside adenylyltransferase domain-containing protein n=1 Tax=Butyrivibrio sp. XPD2006 TaxID=1280668 RepID=UPI0004005A7A|nr:aminoglycoside adenylyltransferase domain-containing protein [Butyrivibrio sp. XPD2006]
MDTNIITASFVEKSKEILQDNLVGVYLHGSAVMGCFNPAKSDLDLIVVVKESISNADKRAYMDMVVDLNGKGPAKGMEMSVAKQSVCRPFVYPTPFELHFSVAHLDWYRNNSDDYVSKMKGEDKDLAAHFTIINHRGKCLYGVSIKDTFADVPAQDYIDSIWEDIANAKEEIAENPMYLILNLARVLAYLKDGVVLSKKEGGEWALSNIPERYHSLIQNAMKDYAEDAVVVYDSILAKEYAGFMLEQIMLLEENKNGTMGCL